MASACMDMDQQDTGSGFRTPQMTYALLKLWKSLYLSICCCREDMMTGGDVFHSFSFISEFSHGYEVWFS